MSRRVTIVMYHFVRDLRRSRYPAIKGLDAADFEGQIGYVREHYDVVRMEDVLQAARDPEASLPDRALLLSFDDGYADPYRTVFPILDAHGLQGSFFPPARAILERRVLDVNKVHFLLAAVDDTGRLVDALDDRVESARARHDLDSVDAYHHRYAHASRWDPPDVVYLKRMLQKGLPEELRGQLTIELFERFVTSDEAAFGDELYLIVEQLRTMRRHGMFVGSHAHDHVWLDTLAPEAQEAQVRASLRFLATLGCDTRDGVMCYPYGAYDDPLLATLERRGCRLGLTTRLGIADLDQDPPLALPRIDANDLPRRADAPPGEGTLRAHAQQAPRS